MLVIFVENVVQDAFGLYLLLQVLAPYLPCSLLIEVATGVKLRNYDEFFQGIVEMFLVVMEGGVLWLLNFLFLLHYMALLFIFLFVLNGNGLDFLDHLFQG